MSQYFIGFKLISGPSPNTCEMVAYFGLSSEKYLERPKKLSKSLHFEEKQIE
jgi:hypothetical protein